MGFNVVNYALSNSYTDESLIGLGALKGKPCTIKSTIKENGQTTIVFEWVALQPDGVTEVKQETTIKIDDGTPIYTWTSGNRYKNDDLVIYNSILYKCINENSDTAFNSLKWIEIGSSDGSYGIVENFSNLPTNFTSLDKKIYYAIEDYTNNGVLYRSGYYLWDGNKWKRTQPEVLDRFTEIVEYESDGTTIKNIDLYFDNKKVITEKDQSYQIVPNYTDIDTSLDKDIVYMVENAEYDMLTGDIKHYSGHYLYNNDSKTIDYIDEKENINIDFENEYISIHTI